MKYRDLRRRQWEVNLSYNNLEANCAADYLTNLGHSYSYGLHLIDALKSRSVSMVTI
ncbi:hypothetical protein LINGRAHAP2_LOCUS21223 [Linum grandiflorum]